MFYVVVVPQKGKLIVPLKWCKEINGNSCIVFYSENSDAEPIFENVYSTFNIHENRAYIGHILNKFVSEAAAKSYINKRTNMRFPPVDYTESAKKKKAIDLLRAELLVDTVTIVSDDDDVDEQNTHDDDVVPAPASSIEASNPIDENDLLKDFASIYESTAYDFGAHISQAVPINSDDNSDSSNDEMGAHTNEAHALPIETLNAEDAKKSYNHIGIQCLQDVRNVGIQAVPEKKDFGVQCGEINMRDVDSRSSMHSHKQTQTDDDWYIKQERDIFAARKSIKMLNERIGDQEILDSDVEDPIDEVEDEDEENLQYDFNLAGKYGFMTNVNGDRFYLNGAIKLTLRDIECLKKWNSDYATSLAEKDQRFVSFLLTRLFDRTTLVRSSKNGQKANTGVKHDPLDPVRIGFMRDIFKERCGDDSTRFKRFTTHVNKKCNNLRR